MTSRPPRVAYCNCPRNLRKSSWLFVESISKWLPYLRTAAWWTLTEIYPQLRFTRHRILRPARIHLSHDFAYCGYESTDFEERANVSQHGAAACRSRCDPRESRLWTLSSP